MFSRPEILLHDLIPPPLHGLAPRTVKGGKWWDAQRHAAAAANMYKCWACNIPKTKAKKHKWLEGHESYEIDWKKGTCNLVEIVSLCHYCHNYIHQGRMRAMVECGRERQSFYEDVLKHGDRLTAHLKRPAQVSPAEMAPWGEWVLLIEGTPYPSRFSSVDEWSGYYNWLNHSGHKDTPEALAYFKDLVTFAGKE